MDIEALQSMNPMVWIIIVAAVVISIAVLFNKAIKWFLKLAAIAVALMFVVYYLVQANVITLPFGGS